MCLLDTRPDGAMDLADIQHISLACLTLRIVRRGAYL